MAVVKDYSEPTGKGVHTSLGTMAITEEVWALLVKNREEWATFGKMNSHLYRAKLFRAMDEAKLTPEARVLVYAMSSIIKSQPRIVEAMTNMPEDKRPQTQGLWFSVRDFFDTRCTQYVSASKKNKKFPVVNLPGTLPGMDILCFCLTTDDHERTMANLSQRPTFAQVNLKEDAQVLAKEGYEFYWTKIIQGTKNTDKVEAPSMNQDYYKTAASDTYSLLYIDKSLRILEVETKDPKGGYSKGEVEHYLRSFDRYEHAHTTTASSSSATTSASKK